MANIGATTAFYKVETSLSRANNEVSKSMERLATGKANANAGDRSSYVAMADTFRLDFVGTKAGIKGAQVVMGYLETGMRVLDSASGLVARLQELAVLAANDTNTSDDSDAIDAEFEAIAVELNRLLETATYKGKSIFTDTAGTEVVSLGGRGAEMSFGLGNVTISDEYEKLYVNKTKIDYEIAISDGDRAEGVAESTLVSVEADPENDVEQELYTFAQLKTAGAGEGYLTGTAIKASDGAGDTAKVTKILEDIQGKLNTARVEAGSQYAALESAVNYTTDLTAQYELGYNTVNDVNFSMETAHLAKNQILQQAATAMLAQANQGQRGLLQLIS